MLSKAKLGDKASVRGKLTPLKRYCFVLLTVILSFTLCLIAGELFLWMIGKQPWPPKQPAGDPRLAWARVAEPDPVLGWRNRRRAVCRPCVGFSFFPPFNSWGPSRTCRTDEGQPTWTESNWAGKSSRLWGARIRKDTCSPMMKLLPGNFSVSTLVLSSVTSERLRMGRITSRSSCSNVCLRGPKRRTPFDGDLWVLHISRRAKHGDGSVAEVFSHGAKAVPR